MEEVDDNEMAFKMAMNFHDLSMSKDITEAAQGRLMKTLHPVLGDWLRSEIERQGEGGDAGHIVVAITKCLTAELGCVVLALSRPKHEATALDSVSALVQKLFESLKEDANNNIGGLEDILNRVRAKARQQYQ